MVFEKAIDKAEPAEEVKQRVLNLIDCITYSVFIYTGRGLFENDKLTFTAQMTFQVFKCCFFTDSITGKRREDPFAICKQLSLISSVSVLWYVNTFLTVKPIHYLDSVLWYVNTFLTVKLIHYLEL